MRYVLILMISHKYKLLDWDNLDQLKVTIHNPGTDDKVEL